MELTPITPLPATVRKLVRNGDQVAVLYSPGYGAGWSTWNYEYREALTFDADIAEHVLAGDQDKALVTAHQKYPEAYLSGPLAIQWVTRGEQFEITEYDGSESVNVIGQQTYMVA